MKAIKEMKLFSFILTIGVLAFFLLIFEFSKKTFAVYANPLTSSLSYAVPDVLGTEEENGKQIMAVADGACCEVEQLLLQGTPNRILISNPLGKLILSTPQDIASTSTPTFAGLTVTNDIKIGTRSLLQFINNPTSGGWTVSSNNVKLATDQSRVAIGTGQFGNAKTTISSKLTDTSFNAGLFVENIPPPNLNISRVAAIRGYTQINPGVTITDGLLGANGLEVRTILNHTSTDALIPSANGAYYSVENRASGKVKNVRGMQISLTNYSSGTGVTESASGVHAVVDKTTGTFTNAFGFYGSVIGSVNAYGVYVPTVTAQNSYGVYINGGNNNFFKGSVGIGTASPSAKLDVEGSIQTNLTGAGTTNALCHSTSGTVNQSIVDCIGTPIADYAEMYPVQQGIETGDIVRLSSKSIQTLTGESIKQLEKSTSINDFLALGVISDNTGDFSSVGHNIDAKDNPKAVALKGRVPVKIARTSLPIRSGDFLTTSTEPGLAQKAVGSGYVIGKALEDWDGKTNKRTVMIFADVGYVAFQNERGFNVPVLESSETFVVQFKNKRESIQYAVSVSPSWDTYTWVTDKTASGFTIHFKNKPSKSAQLDWTITE